MASKSWKLPPEFKQAKVKNGTVQRYDNEPRLYELTKFPNDRTLRTSTFLACCSCGLTHHYTYNVLRTPDGKWYLLTRPDALERTRPKARKRRK